MASNVSASYCYCRQHSEKLKMVDHELLRMKNPRRVPFGLAAGKVADLWYQLNTVTYLHQQFNSGTVV